ncbi:hypothetical protein IFM60648_06294 [Aspergillus lentulus]|uniref:Uncharacterized protein n=1 Tax=Aspergillus lentulus TaxID=293939 RepID=A0ABQ1AHY1_ASPLE|nr:hypothetical protein IFM60648_06294 [Aspergillus lentulus]
MALKLSICGQCARRARPKAGFLQCDTVHAIGTLLLLKYYILSYDSIDWPIRQPLAEQLLVVLSSAAFALVCHSKPSIQPE